MKLSERCDSWIPEYKCLLYGVCKGAQFCGDYLEEPDFDLGEEDDHEPARV